MNNAGRGRLDAQATALLLRRLEGFGPLTPVEIEKLRGVPGGRRSHAARSELYGEGSACPARFVVSGWGCRQRILVDGRRQIVTYLLPGDLVGPVIKPRLASACAGVALTAMETVDITPLLDLAEERDPAYAGLVRALHLLDRTSEVAMRDQVVRVGRQTAYERLLNLFLELRDRSLASGIGEPERYALPLTQEVLADGLGLTVVHVNRTLQQARRDGLLDLKGGVLTLLRTELVEALADWQPLPAAVD